VNESEWVRPRDSKPKHGEIIDAAMNLEAQYARDESIDFSRLRDSIKDLSDDGRARIERCVGSFELEDRAVDSLHADIDRATGYSSLSQAKKDQLSKDCAGDPHEREGHERRELQRLLLEIREVLDAE
jgi:hypothetical protein